MRNNTPFLPKFGPLLFGRPPKSEQTKAHEKLQSAQSLGDLKAACGDSIPDNFLAPTAKGAHSRRRQYSLPVVFWAFVAGNWWPDFNAKFEMGNGEWGMGKK
jgi:hypothetical protein